MGFPCRFCRCTTNMAAPVYGPLLPVTDHAVLREHLRYSLSEGVCEQLYVQLTQGYGPVVAQLGRAQDLGSEPDASRRWAIGGAHRRMTR